MSASFIVTGTDTGVGKTVASAMLTLALDADYFKPVQAGLDQAGLDGETDTETVQRLTGLPPARFLPEVYRLRTPASPHLAAERDGVSIDPGRLVPPQRERPLIIEAAGGLMVPMTRDLLQIDVIAAWGLPVILCARTALGGINHALLSIEALKTRAISIHGIIFVGDAMTDTENTIRTMGGARRLGRLPHLSPLDRDRLAAAFAQHFDRSDFTSPEPGR